MIEAARPDASAVADVWESISDLARRMGVRKSAISKRVTRLEQDGLVHPRPGPLNSKQVNVAEFLHAVEVSTDAIRAANGRAAAPVHRRAAAANRAQSSASNSVGQDDMGSSPNDYVLAREQAKRAAADAELKKMDLEERRERLISAEQAERFVDACSASAQIILGRLPALVDEIVATATKDGVAAAKALVKTHVREAIAEVGAMARMIADPRVKGDAPAVEASDAAA